MVLADLNELAAEISKLSTLGEALLKKSKLKRRTIYVPCYDGFPDLSGAQA